MPRMRKRRQAAPPQTKLDLTIADGPVKTLKPWTEIALPHPDVLASRFKEAEFAADLFAVDAGHATEDYATPENFFRITFLTEGLKRVLTSAVQRLSGQGATLSSAYRPRSAAARPIPCWPSTTSRVRAILKLAGGPARWTEKAVVETWKPPKVAVFVGSSKGADVSLILNDGPKVHTLWGYIAWRLAGEAGMELVAEAEGAHQPRLSADGGSIQARRADRDPARRVSCVRAPASRRPLRSVPVVHSVAHRGGQDGAGT